MNSGIIKRDGDYVSVIKGYVDLYEPCFCTPATPELVRFFELAREAADYLSMFGTPEEQAAYDSYVAMCDEFLAALKGVE